MKKNILLLLCSISFSIQGVEIKKIFHHRIKNNAEQNRMALEMGSLGFYFSQEPRIESSAFTKKDVTHQILFIPGAVLGADDVKKAAQEVNERKDLVYSISIAQVSKPTPGVQISISFPAEKVGLKYDHFKSIKMQNGMIVRLYNKELLKRMDNYAKGIIETAASEKPRVFIDCGHGGPDYGAVANQLREKDINFSIGKQTATLLENKGVAVTLSRTQDIAVPIDARTTSANDSLSQLLVSIHANAAGNSHSEGLETFALCPKLFNSGAATLSMEELAVVDKQFLVKCSDSQRLATAVHARVLDAVRPLYVAVDRKVKTAAPQILAGANMPGILVEVGFVTSQSESKRLASKKYQDAIAQGIVSGILFYLQTV